MFLSLRDACPYYPTPGLDMCVPAAHGRAERAALKHHAVDAPDYARIAGRAEARKQQKRH